MRNTVSVSDVVRTLRGRGYYVWQDMGLSGGSPYSLHIHAELATPELITIPTIRGLHVRKGDYSRALRELAS